MIRLIEHRESIQTIIPTIFPDGTSQVWHINMPEQGSPVTIKWNFESEAEFIHVAQLNSLLKKNQNTVNLEIPYLPYARQDKEISNNSTFAKNTFEMLLISQKFNKITTYDVHSYNGYLNALSIESSKAEHVHKVVEETNPDVIFYPDQGAFDRYCKMFLWDLVTVPVAYGKKVRDQATGNIVSYDIIFKKSLQDKNILIVDDLCDGGATFIEAASKLKELGANNVDLCVSHGVFSKGKEHLTNNGIRNLYYTNSLIKNKDGYEV